MSGFELIYNNGAIVVFVISLTLVAVTYLIKVCKSAHSYITTKEGAWYNYTDPFEEFPYSFTPMRFNLISDLLILVISALVSVFTALFWPLTIFLLIVVGGAVYTRKKYQAKEDFVRAIKGEELSKK